MVIKTMCLFWWPSLMQIFQQGTSHLFPTSQGKTDKGRLPTVNRFLGTAVHWAASERMPVSEKNQFWVAFFWYTWAYGSLGR